VRGKIQLRSTEADSAHQGHPLRHEHPDFGGFAVMGITLTLNRMRQAGKGLSIGLMTVGTALVFAGLYVGGGL
jgi:hypothetical protein